MPEILKHEILEDCKQNIINSEEKEVGSLSKLYEKVNENLKYKNKRDEERAKIANDLALKEFGIEYSTLTIDPTRRAKKEELEDKALAQLPEDLKNSTPPHTDEELLNLIDDESIKNYMAKYTDNSKPEYIRIIEGGRGDSASIAQVIAEHKNILFHCFLYKPGNDKSKAELTYKDSLGPRNSPNVVSILYNGSHFWALYNQQEGEERRKGIVQADENRKTWSRTGYFNKLLKGVTSEYGL
jgi:hypothetical protein